MQLDDVLRVGKCTKSELARLLGITPQSINDWRGTLPELQAYRLKERRPKWFARIKRESLAREEATTSAAPNGG